MTNSEKLVIVCSIFLSIPVILTSINTYNHIVRKETINQEVMKCNQKIYLLEKVLDSLGCDKIYSLSYAGAVAKASELYNVPPEIIISIMKTESTNFNSYDSSWIPTKINFNINGQTKGDKKKEYAYGLMGIKPTTAEYVCKDKKFNMKFKGLNSLSNPIDNILIGTYYLSKLVKKTNINNWDNAVKAYKVGIGKFRNDVINNNDTDYHCYKIYYKYYIKTKELIYVCNK